MGDDGELAAMTSGMSLTNSGAAAEPDDEHDDEHDDEQDDDGSIEDVPVATYSGTMMTHLKDFTKLGIQASGDKSIGCDINLIYKETLALLKANGHSMQEQLVFNIVMTEANKLNKANYVKVNTASVQLRSLHQHTERLYNLAVYDDQELKALGDKILEHLSGMISKPDHPVPDLQKTDYFINTMKWHDVAFLEDMQGYLKTSHKVKELSVQIMNDEIKMAFWTVVQQKERGERDAKKKARALVVPEKAAKKKACTSSE